MENRQICCSVCGNQELFYTVEDTGENEMPQRAYWVCKGCGAKTRSIADVEKEIQITHKSRRQGLTVAAVFAIVCLLMFLAEFIFDFSGALMIMGIVLAIVPLIILMCMPMYQKRIRNLTTQLENLKNTAYCKIKK